MKCLSGCTLATERTQTLKYQGLGICILSVFALRTEWHCLHCAHTATTTRKTTKVYYIKCVFRPDDIYIRWGFLKFNFPKK